MIKIQNFPQQGMKGSKRTHIEASDPASDWFVGFGKSEDCQFEGSWWDMICFARNVLASPNTALVAPEFHHPEWANDNYTGKEQPYEIETKPE